MERPPRNPWTGHDASAVFRFGFLLVPDFTLIGLGAAVDPLRLANVVAGRTLYTFCTLTPDGLAVRSSDGIRVDPDHGIASAPRLDAVMVIGPNPIPAGGHEPIVAWLRGLAAGGVALGGVDTGSYFLARAGLLDGHRCTIHWEDMDVLLDRFPRLVVSDRLYEVDRDRATCSGGIAPLDMMVHLIGLGEGGSRIAAAVADLLIHARRGPDERQRAALRDGVGVGHPKVAEAVRLMECNLEEPLPLEEIASLVQFSVRQFERLFKEHLQTTPRQYYLQLRLARARQLVQRTSRGISDIAMGCGFVSLSHFSHCYHAEFGLSPSAERRRRKAAG